MTGYRHAMARHARARSERAVLGLALFDVPMRPPATTENRVLPLEQTNEGEYQAWRQTEAGQQMYDVIRRRALALVRAGESRLGTKALTEWARSEYRVSLNNNWTALLARELVEQEPELRGAIEMRKRSAT